ncbi:right-handed parallel beta-helix repeat-containing protein [Labilibaculum antarcticum]|uniref:Right handed beta helix domain-containing protein n=1 Tax=Labilibaculum antarcticum TaxID=1717717 RepID=A0A1Y1CT13_9BACT|nr:right-handed parallel beta-helix repeat-containing protein [Labilibaculum antarcticum]BAX82391.1 hypothetical protein ALGA_4100 [Labilibaculum antarcticum]
MRIIVHITLLVLLISSGFEVTAKTYYVNSKIGNDDNTGTRIYSPFKSLDKLSSLNFYPGDSLLLVSDCTFYGSLELRDVHGSQKRPIVIASYPIDNTRNNQRANIDAKGNLNGILLENCSFVEFENISISANGGASYDRNEKELMRCGVLVMLSKRGSYEHIYLKNLLVNDVFFEEKGFLRGVNEVKTANGSQNYGWGIRFINTCEGAFMNGIKIEGCVVKNIAHTGIKLTSKTEKHSLRNIEIKNNTVLETGGPGIQMSGVENVLVRNNFINYSGSNNDSRKWGRGSCLWTWGSNEVLIEKNHFLNAKGPGDSAGAHIDYNCKNIVLQYNFSANNAGGFCEILGNNYNCAYRYNISVNDGYRVKGENGAFQEGKIFWLSGYNGKRKRSGPFNTYFYNNTIYVNKAIKANIAIDNGASGIFIANNIFCIEGETNAVLGDQYNPEKESETNIENLVFQNNLYLKQSNWPKELPIQDEQGVIGSPDFMNAGGDQIEDYIPIHAKLIKNKGMEIFNIPNDSIGLSIGLKVEYDILGNKIKGLPDMGAIELKNIR